jgi:hypothetical protein
VRIAILIAITGMLLPAASGAQTPAEREPAVVAGRFVDGQLSDSAFRHRHCVSDGFGDCPGGVQIVRGYRLGEGVWARDTVRYAVEFQVIGIVGVSEAAPFFMPRAWVDSGEVLVVRRGGHWMAGSPRRPSDAPVRTTGKVARGYFDLDATERRLLDSAAAAPGGP